MSIHGYKSDKRHTLVGGTNEKMARAVVRIEPFLQKWFKKCAAFWNRFKKHYYQNSMVKVFS
ncbi:poly-gamma-glutamate hydrolase family protein [Bacillus stratosphericus]|uniref:poly-gamma-glutamate hydrolase family protein n=1 Tax=Bacillus TaxID=1386 RepID=UPI001CF9D777